MIRSQLHQRGRVTAPNKMHTVLNGLRPFVDKTFVQNVFVVNVWESNRLQMKKIW